MDSFQPQENTPQQTVYIIDDNPEDRQKLVNALIPHGYKPQSWSDGRDFLAVVDSLAPGCILLDVRMPGIDGISIVEHLENHRSVFPIIMVSGRSNISTAVSAIKKGACDFVEKPWEIEDILVRLGEAARNIGSDRKNPGSVFARTGILNKITPREKEVLELLIKGEQNKNIAFHLGIAERTVEMHRSRLMKRLEVKSFAELIRLAVKAGVGEDN